jgi:acetoin utilization protein AcuB
MGLIVFDMGRRIETPVSSPRRRVHAVRPSEKIDPIHSDFKGTPPRSTSNHIEEYTDHEHEPQSVAFAGDVMEGNLQTVTADISLEDAYQQMQTHQIHHLPIISANAELQAIISDRAILKALALKQANLKSTVIEIAARPVYCVRDNTDIRQTARLLCDYHIGALPVINSDNKLTGIITRSDLLRLISDYGPLELWA